MIIKEIEPLRGKIKKIITDSGIFFINTALKDIDFDIGEIDDSKVRELQEASDAFLVLSKALDLLNRGEHTRLLLAQKLKKRGFPDDAISFVLDYLEEKGTLSDERFSESFLASRKREGRTRLLGELQKRGVKRATAIEALDKYFSQNDERAICLDAIRRLKELGKPDDKIIAALVRKGFSYKVIKSLIECEGSEGGES